MPDRRCDLKMPCLQESEKKRNPAFVVWSACYMCLTSLLAVFWSLLIFLCLTDLLFITGADIVNAFLLLLGLLMFPTNLHMLCAIACGRKIDYKGKVFCCPLWLCLLWIIAISVVGAVVSGGRVRCCECAAKQALYHSMKSYRSVPKYKNFIDNLQWYFKCCGLNSYKDWFNQDWYDKTRDFEWDPASKLHKHSVNEVTDSVPSSCCKSGSCLPHYLMELGTSSINTKGCAEKIYRVVKIFLAAHLLLFISIAMAAIIILSLLLKNETPKTYLKPCEQKMNVRHIMSVNDKFQASSGSYLLNAEESEDFEEDPMREFPDVVDIYGGAGGGR